MLRILMWSSKTYTVQGGDEAVGNPLQCLHSKGLVGMRLPTGAVGEIAAVFW